MKTTKLFDNNTKMGQGMIGVNIDFNTNLYDFKPMELTNYDTGLIVPIYTNKNKKKKNKKI